MQRYDEVIDFLANKLMKLTLAEQVNFLQRLIYQFAKDFPTSWLDNELDSEKPHYQVIFQQITQPNWQAWQTDKIAEQLSDLDDIMWQMGEDYPHTTSDAILMLIELLDYWLVLLEFELKSTKSDNIVISAMTGYLNYLDELVETQTGETAGFDTWLDYPQTRQGFDKLQVILAKQFEIHHDE